MLTHNILRSNVQTVSACYQTDDSVRNIYTLSRPRSDGQKITVKPFQLKTGNSTEVSKWAVKCGSFSIEKLMTKSIE